MSRNFIVYQSRNRLTGTLCQTLDTKHTDSTITFNAKKRYVARCVEHNATVAFSEHYPAGRAIAHVDEWCKRCKTMIASGRKVVNKRDMKSGAVTSEDGHEDMRMAMNNNAHDKKWRNKRTRNVAKETQRNADQDSLYLGTDNERDETHES